MNRTTSLPNFSSVDNSNLNRTTSLSNLSSLDNSNINWTTSISNLLSGDNLDNYVLQNLASNVISENDITAVKNLETLYAEIKEWEPEIQHPF